MDTTTLEILRTCGHLETYCAAWHHLGFYKNVALTATYSSTIPFNSSIQDLVFAAITQVIDNHPNLSAILLNEDKSHPNVHFARLPEIDLRTCVYFRQRNTPFPQDGEADEELDGLLTEQHSHDFKEDFGKRPFWRLIISTPPSSTSEFKFAATWIWHHALADGTSAVLLHDSLLAALNSCAVAAHESVEAVVKPPTLPLAPSLEDMHSMHISWPFFIRTILGVLLPSVFAPRPTKLWTGNPIQTDPTPLPALTFKTIVFSAQTTQRLVLACRREETSVTATLQCLLAASLFANLDASQYDKLYIACPISVRPFINVPKHQMVNAVADFHYLHHRPQPTNNNPEATDNILKYFSWAEARTFKSALLAQKGSDNPIALLKYVTDMHAYFTEKLGKPRDVSAEMSNIGVYRGNKKGRWTIGRMAFSQYPGVVAFPFGMSVVTGGDGNAVANFCWGRGAIEEALMQRVMEGVKSSVEMIVGQE